ncbi:MAG: hypothetical protein ACR2FU_08030 [Streptosporangiaceae bacterium]
MNDAQSINRTEADDGAGLTPREAASLLEQTRRQARRRLDRSSPWLSLIGAVVVLAAFGVVWLSARGQHPYQGPTLGGLGLMYLILIAWIALVAVVTRRAQTGVSGRSIRQQRAWGVSVLTALVAVSVLQGALKHDGVSHAIVYGVYPPTAQLIVLGSVGAAIAGSREGWPGFGVGIAVALVAAASAFAGPAGVWFWDGAGCCAAVLAYSAAQAWVRSHESRRP